MAAPCCERLSAVAAHVVAGGVSPHRAAAAESSLPEQPRHTGAVIGLGWMGMLYDLAQRITEVTQEMIDRGDLRPRSSHLEGHARTHARTHARIHEIKQLE